MVAHRKYRTFYSLLKIQEEDKRFLSKDLISLSRITVRTLWQKNCILYAERRTEIRAFKFSLKTNDHYSVSFIYHIRKLALIKKYKGKKNNRAYCSSSDNAGFFLQYAWRKNMCYEDVFQEKMRFIFNKNSEKKDDDLALIYCKQKSFPTFYVVYVNSTYCCDRFLHKLCPKK